MTMHDDDRSGDDGARMAPRALVRPRRSRLRTVAGVAGLAVVLGGGAFAITSALTGEDEVDPRDVTAIDRPAEAPRASESASGAAPMSAGVTGGAAEAVNPPGAEPTKSASTEQQIKETREKAAKDGFPVRRARTPGPDAATPVGEVTETREGPLKDGSNFRIVSARYDLTGQRELLWLGDDGRKVGDARCTQNFRFSNNTAAKERPTMMVCWRTSAGKSVVVVAVTPKGRPDAEGTVAKVDGQWAAMG
ncbi:hypothetical protein [Actinoplanes sp. CA-252034]|uniref:hypothetical protein n=1 Tax=Actinoplanes sp. CA-252034 TaxID=3239906 RepID=UPI003D9619E1